MAKRYGTFTPRRRAALRRAQLISAQKRRANGKKIVTKKRVAVAAGVTTGVVLGVGIARHNSYKQQFSRGYVRQRKRIRAESRVKYGMGPKGTYHIHQKVGETVPKFEKRISKQNRQTAGRLYKTHRHDIRVGLKSQKRGRQAQRNHVKRTLSGRPVATFGAQKALPRRPKSRGY